MSITVNGKKVAGSGPAGLSPYQVAVAGGYTGTESDFNSALVGISNKADKSVPAVPGNLAALDSSGNLIDSGLKVGEANGVAPLGSDKKISKTYLPSVGGFVAQADPPDDTDLFWIDTNETTGGLKYYNGSSWVHVPVAYA